MRKDEIRENIRRLRKEQSEEDRIEKSLLICERLFSLPELSENLIKNMNIALFQSFDGEPLIDSVIIRFKSSGARCFFPAVSNGHLIMGDPDAGDFPYKGFKRGSLGIMEPADLCDDFVKMDIVIIPGIAFTESGNRIGFGKGYYDKYLGTYPPGMMPLLIAPVYDFQITEEFASDDHDVPVDIIVSEKRIFHTK